MCLVWWNFSKPSDAKQFYDDVLLQATYQDNAFNKDEEGTPYYSEDEH